jgi:predicted amidohydrolase YtcJ
MKSWFSLAAMALLSAAMPVAAAQPNDAEAADAIYSGGPIVTVNDAQPSAEALAIRDGRIVYVGSKADAEKLRGAATRSVDLAGRTLMPGFIDGHAHAQQFGTQAVGANLLAPPDGEVNTIDDVVAKLRDFGAGPDVAITGWIYGIPHARTWTRFRPPFR